MEQSGKHACNCYAAQVLILINVQISGQYKGHAESSEAEEQEEDSTDSDSDASTNACDEEICYSHAVSSIPSPAHIPPPGRQNCYPPCLLLLQMRLNATEMAPAALYRPPVHLQSRSKQ